MTDVNINEKYKKAEDVYKDVAAQLRRAKAEAGTDIMDYAGRVKEIQKDGAAFETYMKFREMDTGLKRLVNLYLDAPSLEKAATYKRLIGEYKKAMVDALDGKADAATTRDAILRVIEEVAESYK